MQIASQVLKVGCVVFLLSCTPASPPPATVTLNVMSFNLRLNTPADGEHAWPHRKTLVTNLMQFHRADLIGVQEALKDQLNDLSALLPDFAWLGVGRDDGIEQGEFSAILYRTDRFAVLQHGTFWLSETPQQAGSVGWDAAITRVVTWAEFKDNHTGKTFFHFNTHFDHIGQRAREESARLLLAQIQDLTTYAPAIVTGDFNAVDTSSVYRILTGNRADQSSRSETALTDARNLSALPHYGPPWTYHDFGRATQRPGIDFIFVNHRFKVLRHGALADPEGGPYASDHLPVLAEVVIE